MESIQLPNLQKPACQTPKKEADIPQSGGSAPERCTTGITIFNSLLFQKKQKTKNNKTNTNTSLIGGLSRGEEISSDMWIKSEDSYRFAAIAFALRKPLPPSVFSENSKDVAYAFCRQWRKTRTVARSYVLQYLKQVYEIKDSVQDFVNSFEKHRFIPRREVPFHFSKENLIPVYSLALRGGCTISTFLPKGFGL